MAQHLDGKRIAFAGKLGGANRRQAKQLVRDNGGTPVALDDAAMNLLVVGEAELPLGDAEAQLDTQFRDAAAKGHLEIISETQFWERLGLVDQDAVQLYTPAMLAKLLQVPIQVVRRWHRRGLIKPVREVHRLPYFDFQQVASARQLVKMLASGMSPAAIERKLEQVAQLVPDVASPLEQLSVIVEGKDLLLRQGEGLIDSAGQMRIDFDALEGESWVAGPTLSVAVPQETVVELPPSDTPTVGEMLERAEAYEEQGQIEAGAEMYRAVLAASGPRADVCFSLAELLYRMGQVEAARERYYMAIELDEDYVEARANLGCVLAETGQLELAVAAFYGALRYHADYADVHYHLAHTLDQMGSRETALQFWESFLKLAPDSPWSDEARQRLSQ